MSRVGGARPRFARSLSTSRWAELESFFSQVLNAGYTITPVGCWLRGKADAPRQLVLRHDVDQHPRAALRMAAIEEGLGVRGSYYFRWRTANPRVVTAVRERGHEIGLHYETLSRRVLEGGRGFDPAKPEVLHESRLILREELSRFREIHGPGRTAAPHGDTRVPGVRNAVLLQGEGLSLYGLDYDANEAMRGRRLALWLTDRSTPDGRWSVTGGPDGQVAAGASPILCVLHPNNWASGLGLWTDRLIGWLLPHGGSPEMTIARFPVRTRGDSPPRVADTWRR